MAGPMIEVSGVSKDFLLPHLRQRTLKGHVINLLRRGHQIELQHALCDIGFRVKPGEFFGVGGRNGSGKSTLLKILPGTYPPTTGRVSVRGSLVPFIELGVGFNPELTGRENVYLNGALLGFSAAEVDELYEDIVAFAELESFMDQKLKNYSSGMQVRIAFAVATRAKADILLIDEVLAVGDTAFQRKCFEHFRALKKSGTTIVFVTHDMTLVRQFCDRVIMLEDGRLVAEGAADQIADEYMRLFNKAAKDAAAAVPEWREAEKRWGEGGVRYTSVRIPEALGDEGELILELEAVAERDIEHVAFGFSISDSSGVPILGTNTSRKRRSCGGMTQGERVRMRWSIPNVFSDGRHLVEATITDASGLTVYDSWKEAASFTVVRDEKTPYMVLPEMSFDLTRLRD